MKKPIYFGSLALAVLALCTMLVFSACKKEPTETQTCSVYGTFTSIPCGVGLYNNLWIRLDDGKLLQPCQTTLRSNIEVYEGMRVKLGYVKASGADVCDPSRTVCMVLIPNHDQIKITCIEVVNTPVQCNKTGTVVHHFTANIAYCDRYLIMDDNGNTFEPVNQDMMKPFANNQRVTFAYQTVYTFAATCSGYGPVQVTCIQPLAETCIPFVNSATLYNDLGSVRSDVGISDAYLLDGHCLKIKVGFSGCNADISRFSLELVAKANGVAYFRVADKLAGQITCKAYFTQTLSFEVSSLLNKNWGNVSVNAVHVAGWSQDIPLY